ncbi:MAG TPA: hypothetical protein DFR83_29480 [Deltaproteobacteria bacterium]|nr:hypothetical protein [Deltaproteobacteria bacterium]
MMPGNAWRSERAGWYVEMLDALLVRLGLATDPSVAGRWAVLRARLSGHPALGASLAGLPLRVELLQLGVALLDRRPARSAEILALFGEGSVDLRHRRLLPIDLHVGPMGGGGLAVSLGTRSAAIEGALEQGSAVREALDRGTCGASAADSFILRVHLESLDAEGLAAADRICWERLLTPMHDVPVHLVRCVAARKNAHPRSTIDTVAFVSAPPGGATRVPSFAERERAEVVRSWPDRVVADGTLSADLVHAHMHGMGGQPRGGIAPEILAQVLVMNACDAATSDGMVVDAVVSGAVRDAFGFDGPLRIAAARTVARVLHAELALWPQDPSAGVMFAGLAVRRCLAGRDICGRWRHYQGVPP